ncbi:MAG TPA: HAMP domain-containing sensor histidine kinase [Rhodothermia bacterium]
MSLRSLADGLLKQYVDSLHFESEFEFRRQMGRLVKRNVTLVGFVGPLALAIYLFAQIVLLGKTTVWSYPPVRDPSVIVLWDKLVMLVVFLALLGGRRFLPDDRPAVGRVAMLLASMLVVTAITLDDVGAWTIHFSPAYLTFIIVFLAVALPMDAVWAVTAIGLVIAAGYVSVALLAPIFGLPQTSVDADQGVYLAVISIIATAASSSLYTVRHEEYVAKKSAEDLSRVLADTNRTLENAMLNLTSAQDRLIYAEKMASLGRFAAGVAHEMRNPLNFVVNFARLSIDLIDESEGESGPSTDTRDIRSNLERIQEHALRAEQIVRSLIVHSEQRSSQPSAVDLNELIRDQSSVLSKRYDPDRSGYLVLLVLDLDDAVGQVEAMASELTYAFDNVLDNAYRATIDRALTGEEGYEPEIVVSATRIDDRVRIEIRDNGVGIADGESGQIFEPFYTTRPAGSGTGLGLSAAYAAITQGHGGSISVQSEPGVGSVFTIELPVTPPSSRWSASD